MQDVVVTTKETPAIQRGMVSVIIVNYKGADNTIACLKHFERIDWPADRLELIVVENSADGGAQAQLIRDAVPRAVVVDAGANTGFAGGCNTGVAHAHGEWVGLINNDARPDPAWISAAVAAMKDDPSVGCVASKVLDWDGQRVDYVGSALTWFGMGYKPHLGLPDGDAYDQPANVLFSTGAAMLLPTEVFREVGGFDERFFMFFEDVDLGWRLNLLGWQVRYVPQSVAYHHHHASMGAFGSFREEYLLERNALLCLYKNLGDEALARMLPAAMALSVRRAVTRGEVDPAMLDLQLRPGGDDVLSVEVSKRALTGPLAVDYLVECLTGGLAADRAALQAARRRPDTEIFPLFGDALNPGDGTDSYLGGHAALVHAFGVAEQVNARTRVLVVTDDVLAPQMAGPGIRAWQIADAVARAGVADVRLVSTSSASGVASERFTIDAARGRPLQVHTDWADVIVFQGKLLHIAPWLKDSTKILVADVYDPMHLEALEQARGLGAAGRANAVHETTGLLNEQLERADLVLCASEKQRDFWLGHLASIGRVNPVMYEEDSALESLITVVPFGLGDEPPQRSAHGIKGAVPGISATDKVILWGGGVYNWFDPLTLVRAVAHLVKRRPDVKLYFMGLKHPNPDVPDMRIAWELRNLSDELGLTGTSVFFNDGWVPYGERANYLLDADLGVSTHYHHIETAFSFRTRILDYLWAGLPIVATKGDTFASWIDEHGLGVTVPAEDEAALEAALERLLFDDDAIVAARKAVVAFTEQFRWRNVLAPLVEFCAAPRRAADLAGATAGGVAGGSRFSYQRPSSLARDLRLARDYMRLGGPGELVRRAAGRLRRVGAGR